MKASDDRPHLLVLGLSSSNIPLLEAVRGRSKVCLIGSDWSPQAAGRPYVEVFFSVSYQEVDRIARLLNQRGIRACEILLGTTMDAAFETLVVLGSTFSSKPYPPLATIRRCRNKLLLDDWLKQNGFDHVGSSLLENEPPGAYPVVVKSLSTKNGPTYRLRSLEEFVAFETANNIPPRAWIMQSEIRGPEYRVDLFPGGSYLILHHEGGGIYRNILGQEVCGESALALRCALSFHHKNGLNSQIVKYDIIVQDSRPYLIDVGFDHPLRFEAVTKAIGASYWEAYLAYALGNRDLFSGIIERIQETYYIKGVAFAMRSSDL
jgi:hypothetical protein